jgi:hypothetical protein
VTGRPRRPHAGGQIDALPVRDARGGRREDDLVVSIGLQLDWCINYLDRIRKSSIADALGKNRALIWQQMNRSDD